MNKVYIFLFASLCLASAQEIEPRIYSNVPKDINFFALSYSYGSGNILSDPALPIEDFKAITHTPAITYVRTMGFLGKLWKFQITQPFTYMAGDVKISGKDTSGTKTGFTDTHLRLAVNLFGSPAIALNDFNRFQQSTILGASLVVSVPLGQYDKTKRVNLGSNRWGFKPEVGFSHRIARWYLEAYAGVWFFTENQEFLETMTIGQKHIYTFQWHINYQFKAGPWVSLDGGHANGGRITIDDTRLEIFHQNFRLGGAITWSLNLQHSIKLIAHTGVYTKLGTDFDVITVAYQYLWK